jgi:hypothetical protein
MKKLIITSVLAIMPFFTFAQQAFDKFENQEGIDGVIINEKLIDVLGGLKLTGAAQEVEGYLKKVKSFESFRVFSTSDKKHAREMRNTVEGYLKKHPMDELMTVKEEGTLIKIYMVNGATASEIKELIVFTNNEKDNETMLVSFIGNIDLASEQVNSK